MGELVAVRAPPGRWMLIDGCTARSRSYGELLLRHYSASPDILVFTHPHVDHARGVKAVIDAATAESPDTWPRLGMILPPALDGAGRATDPQAFFDGGIAEDVVATILDRWERHHACRWDMGLGAVESLGDADVLALSPEPAARREARQKYADGKKFDANRLAAALLVEWSGRRFILGSDLPETPGSGWTRALRRERLLARHSIFKVAHHGSGNAMHTAILRRPKSHPAPLWVVTPYASLGLPSFGRRGGMRRLLRHVTEVHLTALPRAYRRQSASPLRLRFKDLQGKRLHDDAGAPGFPDCFVAAIFSSASDTPRVVHGPGSVVVGR